MKAREYTYKKGNDGEDILTDVYWSGIPSKCSSPIAIIYHAGGFVKWSKEVVPKSEISALAKIGFVVIVPNYRLCPQISIHNGPITDSRDCLVWAADELPGLLQNVSVEVDPTRIVTMGHSAGGTLALLMGSAPEVPVTAVLDFYGLKYFSDPTWRLPIPEFEQSPSWPQEYIDKVYEGHQVSASPRFLWGDTLPPRDAWFATHMKEGTLLDELVQNEDKSCIDGTARFSTSFPRTMFIHGTADKVTNHRFSERAHEELKRLGVVTDLLLADGEEHVFDLTLEEDDMKFVKYVLPGLKFLARAVGLL
ncbi:Alpha/Beta hydrolase protein [Aspergillus tamarii]|uniref:Alpha/Beta hydrolase protein n=1 Tax=Aspergillus tamarii TaxID=41984 RepID=A0A5N6V9B9_ASPTM|nr:Alpha/Beta hydrolase protein [Aspergillus tamarii]